RLHRRQAIGRAVARLVVHVPAPQAERAMVAMLRSRCVLRDVGAAVVAAERRAAADRRLVERLRLLTSRAPPARHPGRTPGARRGPRGPPWRRDPRARTCAGSSAGPRLGGLVGGLLLRPGSPAKAPLNAPLLAGQPPLDVVGVEGPAQR